MSLIDPGLRSHIKHIQVDLNRPGKEIAQVLQEAGVIADYAFFYAYIEPKGLGSGMDHKVADALYMANVPLFENFLQALEVADITPKRILLQTGAKSYGPLLGRSRHPFVESDPEPRHLTNNFYYGQEDALYDFCKRHPESGWNVVRPSGIIGVTQGSPLNLFFPLAVYAAVQAHKGEPLNFNGDFSSWQREYSYSTARLTGYLSEWAVLENKCRNQAFNAQDGETLTWDRFYERLVKWFGVRQGAKVPDGNESYDNVTVLSGGKDSPLGYGPPSTIKTTFNWAEWFRDPSNKASWEEIMRQSHGRVTTNVFDLIDPDTALVHYGTVEVGTLAQNKARLFGFSGFVDSLESIFEMYQEYVDAGILPQLEVMKAGPLI
ncbi:hypothetical protein QQX98_008311 [Neonectria punicea]|uniref:PRISE-like Rossmann-fold domain-containing protein n=1 Tax=Neonectria punicea TaxID=979145 RepID=A0ABR1GVI8_9HYPO